MKKMKHGGGFHPSPMSLALWIVAKLICSCLCLLDANVALHAISTHDLLSH